MGAFSFEPLTPRRAVDLTLRTKTAQGATPKTIGWYQMIIERAIRSFDVDPRRPIYPVEFGTHGTP